MLRLFFVSSLVVTTLTGCGIFQSSNCRDRRTPTHDPRTEVVCDNPLLEAARCVTTLEDELRREGTISVKTPDVWSDANLMHSIQEFDTDMKKTLDDFSESIQAVASLSDIAKVASETTVAGGLNGTTTPEVTPPKLQSSDAAAPSISAALAITKAGKLSLEPTQLERQHATYLYVNQAIQRQNMGGDNIRKGGYGLYLFRIPVSVLPGEETSRGYAAMASFRAQMKLTEADTKYTLQRMAIADLVDALAQKVENVWKKPSLADVASKQLAEFKKRLQEIKKQPQLNGFANQLETLMADYSDQLSPDELKTRDKLIVETINFLSTPVARTETIRQIALAKNDLDENPDAPQDVTQAIGSAFVAISPFATESDKRSSLFGNFESSSSPDQQNKPILTDSKEATEAFKSADKSLAKFKLWKKLRSQGIDKGQTDMVLANTRWWYGSGNSTAIKAELPIDKFPGLLDFSVQEIQTVALEPVRPIKTRFVQPVSTSFNPNSPDSEQKVVATGIKQIASAKFNTEDVDYIRDYLKETYGGQLGTTPAIAEIRKALTQALSQIEIRLERRNGYSTVFADQNWSIVDAAKRIERGLAATDVKNDWINQYKIDTDSQAFLQISWLLARQCGIVDLNLKRLLEELRLKGEVYAADVEAVNSTNFFAPEHRAEATRLWQLIVKTEFPLQVFTLEPKVEEQNLIEASSQLRDLQLALAASIAQGGWNVGQKIALARQLANDTAAIGLNRTAVGFVHGEDTFGWYFRPRAQSIAETKSNMQAFREVVTGNISGSPRLRRAQYELEPGMRECEVLISMPEFVSGVEFDITTNWESLRQPGRAKNTYEELVAQGALLNQAKCCVDSNSCTQEFRNGDLRRLRSRVDQLENMLALQTISVDVPYEPFVSGQDLLTDDIRSLDPQIFGVYGLQFLAADAEKGVVADFFITGKNFHPTQTHVVVGGHESHGDFDGNGESDVEIISRELLRVRTTLKQDKLSGDFFEVRVGTPNGLSNPLTMNKKKAKAPETPKSDFDWSVQPKYSGFVGIDPSRTTFVKLTSEGETNTSKIKKTGDHPFGLTSFPSNAAGSTSKNAGAMLKAFGVKPKQPSSDFELVMVYEIEFESGTKSSVTGSQHRVTAATTGVKLRKLIELDLAGKIAYRDETAKINATAYLRFDEWNFVKFNTKTLIELYVPPCADCRENETGAESETSSEANGPSDGLKLDGQFERENVSS